MGVIQTTAQATVGGVTEGVGTGFNWGTKGYGLAIAATAFLFGAVMFAGVGILAAAVAGVAHIAAGTAIGSGLASTAAFASSVAPLAGLLGAVGGVVTAPFNPLVQAVGLFTGAMGATKGVFSGAGKALEAKSNDKALLNQQATQIKVAETLAGIKAQRYNNRVEAANNVEALGNPAAEGKQGNEFQNQATTQKVQPVAFGGVS